MDPISIGGEFVVQGRTVEGQIFQPKDWAELLCAEIAKAGAAGHPPYDAYLHPIMIGGVGSLVVRGSLKEADPKAFDMVKRYIADHRLLVRAGRGDMYIETTGAHPVYGRERRDPGHNSW